MKVKKVKKTNSLRVFDQSTQASPFLAFLPVRKNGAVGFRFVRQT
jgi:hypothetical protein